MNQPKLANFQGAHYVPRPLQSFLAEKNAHVGHAEESLFEDDGQPLASAH